MSTISQPLEELSRFTINRPFVARLLAIAQIGAIVLLLRWAWNLTAIPVTVTVDGISEPVHTHRRTLSPLLADLGIALNPADRLRPSPSARLQADLRIELERARPVRLLADGRDVRVHTWAVTARQALADGGIAVDDYDRVLLGGKRIPLDAPLPQRVLSISAPTYGREYGWEGLVTEPLPLRVYRAIPITVDDGNVPFSIRTTAQTVGEALREAEITIYLGDKVQPSLGSPVSTGLRVFIQRSTPISLRVDGRLLKTRTRGRTVGDALTEMGLGVAGLDQIEPTLKSELYDNAEIRIVRVREDVEIEEDIVPFETVFRPDANLLIDTQQLVTAGAQGITRSRFRVRYEDGVEVQRELEDKWQAQQPAQRVIAYGQRIAPQTLTTASGESVTYWRKVRMSASSYSAGTAGVSPDAPWYGVTRSGERMRFGIVAVDPSVVPFRSRVYVPGYGYGDALDTGSAVRSKRIDLGYDDSNLVLWHRWVDVYLVWPPPPAHQITWVLPNWPIEK
ncbi:MAG: DUF348 domain-containing protein [Caldilineaceae bacterium]|nr:DUF348 domain-containing protein [Caldilineaceae bacterium]HRJ41918.1 ubiquitin-like domain-containing protein [Caldilineaceae bacterium]